MCYKCYTLDAQGLFTPSWSFATYPSASTKTSPSTETNVSTETNASTSTSASTSSNPNPSTGITTCIDIPTSPRGTKYPDSPTLSPSPIDDNISERFLLPSPALGLPRNSLDLYPRKHVSKKEKVRAACANCASIKLRLRVPGLIRKLWSKIDRKSEDEDEDEEGLLMEKMDAKVGRRSIRRRLGWGKNREEDRELKRERQVLEPSWVVAGGVIMDVEDEEEAWEGF